MFIKQIILLISSECVSHALLSNQRFSILHCKSQGHVFYPPIKQKMTALFQVTTDQEWVVCVESDISISEHPNGIRYDIGVVISELIGTKI